jgi:hypothetical protein
MFGEKKHGSLGSMRAEDVAAFVRGRKKNTSAMSQLFIQDGQRRMIQCGGCNGSYVFLSRQLIFVGSSDVGSLIPDEGTLDVADVPDGLTWTY